jgi:hypothetical protein
VGGRFQFALLAVVAACSDDVIADGSLMCCKLLHGAQSNYLQRCYDGSYALLYCEVCVAADMLKFVIIAAWPDLIAIYRHLP